MIRWLGLVLCVALLTGCASETVLPEEKRLRASDLNAQLGAAYMNKRRYEVALDKLQKALEFNEDNGKAHHYLGELYRRLGEEEKARSHYERAFELIPENAALLNNYGVFLCAEGNYEQADIYFTRALSDPLYADKARVYENRGLCAQRKGNLQEAQRYFEKALGINANLPTSLLQMAQLSFDRGETQAAHVYYQRYLSLARQTPESLWLGILLEMENGDKDKVASYSVLLRNKFPKSEQAGLLRELRAKRDEL